VGEEIFLRISIGEPDMPTAVRVSAAIPASKTASDKSDSNQFVSIALFSGIGLFVSLVAVILGVQGVWY
jgi:hypothetical protein